MTKKFDVAFELLNEYELVASSQHETKKEKEITDYDQKKSAINSFLLLNPLASL